MGKLNEKNVEDQLIATLMFYGAFKDWSPEELVEKYNLLGVPIHRVNEVLNGSDED